MDTKDIFDIGLQWVQARRMEAQVQISTIEMNDLNMQEDRSTTPTQTQAPPSSLPEPNTPGQARRLRVQETGTWQPGMPVRFG